MITKHLESKEVLFPKQKRLFDHFIDQTLSGEMKINLPKAISF
jgi:hypothetical protein